MIEKRETLKEVKDQFPLLVSNLETHFEILRNEERFIEYMVLGSQLIDHLLYHVLLNLQHALNFSSLVNELEKESKLPLEVDLEVGEDQTLGEYIKIARRRFKMDEYRPDLMTKLEQFNSHRRNSVHNIVKDFSGDISKANESLRPYCKGMPVEIIITWIVKLQGDISDDMAKRNGSDLVDLHRTGK